MNQSPLSKAQTLLIAALALSLIACALVPWLAPSSTAADIQLTNEAVIATNAAIESAVIATQTALAEGTAGQAPTDTPDPCTGWWCDVRGVVYAETIQPGNELESASVKLGQSSYCSRTRGQYGTATGPDGAFEFGQLFFHDTDRIWIQVEYEGYEPTRWDSVDYYCLYCSCFGSPLELVLQAAPGQ
jgi:hypothetical protein